MNTERASHTFSPGLFWDIDPAGLGQQHNAWFISRVLNFGDIADWRNLFALYSLAEIKEVAETRRDLNPKSRNFALLLLTAMEAEKIEAAGETGETGAADRHAP